MSGIEISQRTIGRRQFVRSQRLPPVSATREHEHIDQTDQQLRRAIRARIRSDGRVSMSGPEIRPFHNNNNAQVNEDRGQK